MSLRLTSVSGLGGKTPACFLVEIDGKRLLLDLGEGPDVGVRPDLAGIGRVDAVLLSHAHVDHTGALDALPELGNPPVYASAVTGRLIGRAVELLPLQGAVEVMGLPVQTGRSGHAPGGIWMRIDVDGGLLYMGDHSAESGLYAYDVPPPSRLAIIDASYGDYDVPIADGLAKLKAAALAGPVLLPCPAGGRGPEMALALADIAPIALCPSNAAIVGLLLGDGSDCLRPGAAERLFKMDFTILGAGTPATGVMIAAKPNATGGVAGALVKRWQEEGPAILFTGYLGKGTPAEELTKSGRAGFERWNVHPPLSDLKALVRDLAPEVVVPAFGDQRHLPVWQAAFAPAKVSLDRCITL
jgi:hypothetical protein